MKITYIDLDDIKNPLLGSGQGRATYNVASRLVKMGHSVRVLCSKYPKYQDRIQDGIQYVHIGLATPWIILNNAIFFIAAPWAVIHEKTDVIIECLTAPASTLLSPIFSKAPVIALPSMFNAHEFAKKYHLPFHWYEWIGLQFYKYMAPYSEVDQAKAKSINPRISTRIIGQGVGEEFFKIKSKKPEHILCFGRLDIYQKGLDLLLEAYSKVKDQIGYPIVFAGHGPDEKNLKQLVKKYHLEKYVSIIGPTYGDKKVEVFSKSLFVAFPSRHDEMCLATLEVLASGLPVVCFDIPESHWISTDVSIKVTPLDTSKFAQALIEASSSTRRLRLKSYTRPFAKKFSWEEVAKQFDSYIKEVVFNEKK